MKPLSFLILFFFSISLFRLPEVVAAPPDKLSDEGLLDLIEQKALDYFVTEVNPANGLIPDHANNTTRGATLFPASVAAVGFALTAYGVGVSRGWMSRNSGMDLTRRTLEFLLKQAPQEHGFFYHFMDMKNGQRMMQSEVSPIDTTLLLAGALFAAEYYQDPEIKNLAQQIYERVDWQWMMQDGKTLRMAWNPDTGFMRYRWDSYCESMIMYLLAIGSPTHPIPASSWKEIKRPIGSYKNHKLIYMPPLFTHQYSHIWVDFKDKNDGIADYFKNSVEATLANRQFAIDNADKYKTYGPDSWGLTASDGPGGYKAYGASPGWAVHDGTVAPTACGSSIVFTPKKSISCLRHFYEKHYDKLWGSYGFADAFNLDKNWFSKDVYGIDQGPLILMIENYRSGLIWKTMKGNSALNKALKAVGFKPGTKKLDWPDPPQANAIYVPDGIRVDGFLRDWPNGQGMRLDKSEDEKDFKGEIRFAWNENALYFYLRVSDNSLMTRTRGKNIWQDDVLEIYIDPQDNGLIWGNAKDFEIGFRPDPDGNAAAVWSWFQEEDPVPDGKVTAASYVYPGGYLIEGAISWRYLGIRPKADSFLRLSPAVHDIDKNKNDRKYEWFLRPEGGYLGFQVGKIFLKKTAEKKPGGKNDSKKAAA